MDPYQKCVVLEEGPKLHFQDIYRFHDSIAKTAIKSLDNLNEQIVQYIFTPAANGDTDIIEHFSSEDQETLHSSMVLIRGLLNEAQIKFRKMVEDNKQLADKIDGSIQATNEEVSALRGEIANTNKRLSFLSDIQITCDKEDQGVQCNINCTCGTNSRLRSDEENESIRLRDDNIRLEQQLKHLSLELDDLRSYKQRNCKLHPSYGELKLEILQRIQEINRAKEALQAMKSDRKRLKAEKLDLLCQMKQLYGTLEDKEAELRDFIRSYEQRMRESDDSIKQLAKEKDDCEREKWEIIRRARDASERSVILGSQLENRDQLIKKLESEIFELKEQTLKRPSVSKRIPSPLPRTPPSLDLTSHSEDLPPYETPPPSASYESKEMSFSVPDMSPENDNQQTMTRTISSLSQDLLEMENKKKRKKNLNRSVNMLSLSRMFKSRSRRSIALTESQENSFPDSNPNPRVSLLNEENYQEKLQLVNQSKGIHISKWKANLVLSWLEIVLSMPMYGQMCAENIKSGKVLLGLSDSELTAALGISNPIHRKKLRLAIEEQRDPADAKFPKACIVDHTWVAHRWIPDVGLPQYTNIFEKNLIDARILNTLARKDFEKYLVIHRKFHQLSILHAIELLRRMDFDKEKLNNRRSQCDKEDCDLLVWTNQRVIKWIENIDLEEYSSNLKESGVHGALMVLEPSFNSETLATALGIPPSKSYVRRHLATELDSLLKPARSSIDAESSDKKKNSSGSYGRSFTRSYRGSAIVEDENSNEHIKTRFSLRGSLGRAFGRKVREDMRMSFDDETPKRKISAPVSVTHSKLFSPVISEHEPALV